MVVIEAKDNRLRESTIVLTRDLFGIPLMLINTMGICRYCHDHTAGADYRIRKSDPEEGNTIGVGTCMHGLTAAEI